MVITLLCCLQDCNFLQATCFGNSSSRGPRLRTIIHNVFVSYLKNWQRSQIAPIIHISGSWNSCILRASHDCRSLSASRKRVFSQHQALQSISHSSSGPALALGLTLLALSLLTTSRLAPSLCPPRIRGAWSFRFEFICSATPDRVLCFSLAVTV